MACFFPWFPSLLYQGIPYEIDDDVEVVSTPGHTGSDVSVLVTTESQGVIAVAGSYMTSVFILFLS